MSAAAEEESRHGAAPTVALLLWGDSFDDFLDGIGLSFEQFRDEMSGGWAFGYVQALASVGVRTVLLCVSHRVRRPERHRHAPTGATIVVLPAPAPYRALRRLMRRPDAWSADDAFGTAGRRWPVRAAAGLLHDVASYTATPALALARALRGERCVALVCQEYEDARFDHAVVVGRALGLPVFATFQGGDRQRSRLERLPRACTIHAAAGLVVASGREAARVRRRYGLPAARVGRVFNPLDLDLWRPVDRPAARRRLGWDDDERVVVWHGRVDLHRKGLDVLVAAWARVVERRPHDRWRLHLVGTGADAARLRALLAALPAPAISWQDEYLLDRPALRDTLSAADVSVLPSRHEGFAVALVEAMACGTGVVAADAPGVRDVLDRGRRSGGILVPRGDAAALADALEEVLGDPALAAALGRAARRRAEAAFSLGAVGARLRRFLVDRGAPLGPLPAGAAGPAGERLAGRARGGGHLGEEDEDGQVPAAPAS